MTLFHIAAFIGLALAVRLLPGLPDRWRSWAMLGLSVSALFWLQPSTPIRNLDFWLPITTLALTIFTWAVTRPAGPLERELGGRGPDNRSCAADRADALCGAAVLSYAVASAGDWLAGNSAGAHRGSLCRGDPFPVRPIAPSACSWWWA